MDKLIDLLNNIVKTAFDKAGFEAGFDLVTLSNRPDLCEYQCNKALPLAKSLHKPPMDIAGKVAEILTDNTEFSMVSTCPPGFINMDLSKDFLAAYIEEMGLDKDHGLIKSQDKEKIIIDYGGANVAKPLHVGHLRSAVIGEALKRIGRALGNEIIADVHLGDFGLQMGLIIVELEDRGMRDFTLSDLEEIYPAASKKSKELGADGKPTAEALKFKERALLATKKLQEGDREYHSIWDKIIALSLPDLKANYKRLNVDFDLWKGESDAAYYIEDMTKDMIAKGFAYESEGALVVDISEEGDKTKLPPCLIRKKDGAFLYATTDLATLIEREKLYKPDAYIYVADARQSLHYKSFFRVAKKTGIVPPERKLSFLGFGTMNGKDGGPFKTREGGVMRLELLLDEVRDAVLTKTLESHNGELSNEEAMDIAAKVSLSAIKYGDLSNQASKDYIFDIDRFISFEGNTGPYILYTIVRASSILSKVDSSKADKSHIKAAFNEYKSAYKLSLILSRYNEAVLSAWKDLAPHKLCAFMYELSNGFNTLYGEAKIIAEPREDVKQGLLELTKLTKEVLISSVDMLGIVPADKM